MFNLLDYAAGTVPVGSVDSRLDILNPGPYSSMFDRELGELFDPAIFEGAPTGVQVICRRYEEEKCLAVTTVVDAAVKAE